MRRRVLLTSGVLVVTGAALTPLDAVAATQGMTDTLEDVLVGRTTAPAIAARQLAAQIAAARADFRACRYTQLAHRLPRLMAQAIAGREQTTVDHLSLAAGQVAQTYNVTTDLLIKLHDDGMAWATSDRAVRAAHASGDPLIEAEASRLAAIVARRTRHRTGSQLTLVNAAQRLHATTGLTHPEQTAMYAQLLATAAYTSAMNDDRDTALTLLGEAAHRQDPASGIHFTNLDLAVYKISVARILGDHGVAVEHSQTIDPTRITSPERRARYWEDTAQEVQYRPWAQRLARELISSRNRHTLHGINEFAHRIGATA
jgi:hypothetical protein